MGNTHGIVKRLNRQLSVISKEKRSNILSVLNLTINPYSFSAEDQHQETEHQYWACTWFKFTYFLVNNLSPAYNNKAALFSSRR